MEKDRIIDALKKDNAEVVENYMELKKIRQQRFKILVYNLHIRKLLTVFLRIYSM